MFLDLSYSQFLQTSLLLAGSGSTEENSGISSSCIFHWMLLRFRSLVILKAKLKLLYSIVVLSLVTRQCNHQAQKLYGMESVGLGKVLPGAVNDGGCTFSQGYYENRAFIVSPPNRSNTQLACPRCPGICLRAQCHNSHRTVGMGADVI